MNLAEEFTSIAWHLWQKSSPTILDFLHGMKAQPIIDSQLADCKTTCSRFFVPARFLQLCLLYSLFALSLSVLRLPLLAQTNKFSPPVRLGNSGIDNFYQLNPNLYSGSAPDQKAGFAALQQLGIRTVITVDGAKPDVATAKKYGLRYVHIPFGYDGVPTNQALQLVKAAQELPKPIFIHCHHGLHRGPAGAAIIGEGTQGWTPEEALDWLKAAGTSTNYLGLYKSVSEFRKPSQAMLNATPSNFPETTEISPLGDAMVAIDEHFDHLTLLQKAGYQPSTTDPDLVPAHEALLLKELFTELLRSPDLQIGTQDFQKQMTEAARGASELHSALSANPFVLEKANTALKSVNNSCTTCHKKYRNVTTQH